MGCAKDIVERVGVPRFLFSDFPLGNAAGRPNDTESQALTMELALATLESAPGPRTTVQSPLKWGDTPDWKLDFQNIDQMSEEEIKARKAAFDNIKEVAEAGVDMMVAGSAILKEPRTVESYKETIDAMREELARAQV